jgi:methyl-accepting chemotaxis protein
MAMKDLSLRYTEASIKMIIEDLERDYEKQISNLQQHHEKAMLQWKEDSTLSVAYEAAYKEELEQLRSKFNNRLKAVQEEVNSLVKVSSERLLSHLETLQLKIQELFAFINKSIIAMLPMLLLRSENFL